MMSLNFRRMITNKVFISAESENGLNVLVVRFRFPLQDADRLQQWLTNMGRGNWTPSRYHYICHEHFSPECIKMRWGIRYLENDAVPTIFQKTPVMRK